MLIFEKTMGNFSPLDKKYMQLAIKMARKGQGMTSPNPLVGSVLVREGQVVGRGFHRRAGEPHAEINALQQAGEKAREAVLYVNLEPCVHFGRTPPCVPRIIDAGVKEVIVAMLDPDRRVMGKGLKTLQNAGISTRVGLMKEEAVKLNEIYLKYKTTGRPFVIMKAAMSLNGKIATRTGDSRWITSEFARHYAHWLRWQVDAILVGINTVLTDNPFLTVRYQGVSSSYQGFRKKWLRIVLDSKLRIPLKARVLENTGEYPTLIVTSPLAAKDKIGKLQSRGVEVLVMEEKGQISFEKLVEELGKREITSVLIEGGGTINASALAAGVVDKIFFFIAPRIIGGEKAISVVAGEGVEKVAQAWKIEKWQVRRLGEEILIEGYPEVKQ